MVVIAAEPIDFALGQDLLVARADGQPDAARREVGQDIGGELALGHEVEPPAVVYAVGHADGLEVGLARVLAGIGRGEAVDEADTRVVEHAAVGLRATVGRHGEAVRDRDVVLHGLRTVEVVQARVPDAVLIALVGLHDGLVEGEPAANLLAEGAEGFLGVVRVRLDDLAVLPSVVQVHEALELGRRAVM